MPEMFDINEDSLGRVQDRPYEGDYTGRQKEGYFSDVDVEGERRATPGTEEVALMPEGERREQMQDFVYTICTAIGEFLDVSEKVEVSLSEPERQNLGEHWGNVLFHYWQIKTRKGLDVANATAYTTGLGVKKAKEIKDKRGLNTDE